MHLEVHDRSQRKFNLEFFTCGASGRAIYANCGGESIERDFLRYQDRSANQKAEEDAAARRVKGAGAARGPRRS